MMRNIGQRTFIARNKWLKNAKQTRLRVRESPLQGQLARRVRWGGCRNVYPERDKTRCVLTQFNIFTRFFARVAPHIERCGVLHEDQSSVEVMEASCSIQAQQLELW